MRRGAWIGLLILASCSGGQEGSVLRLLEFRQMDFESVALNEELQFFFSADLDRSSVTSDSVRILDEQGHEVAVERSVRRNALTVLPELPCAPDLRTALSPRRRLSRRPGSFPRPDGTAHAGSAARRSCSPSARPRSAARRAPFLDLLPGRRAGPARQTPKTIELEDGVLVLGTARRRSVERARLPLRALPLPGR
jgi:hypothetical protein